MAKNETNEMKGISRMDAGSTHGWFLRVYHRGEVYRKFFSDSVYGNGDTALQAALVHRDAYVREHQIKYLPFFTVPMKSNTTGVHGVSETFQLTSSREKIPCFSVFWATRRNERRTKRFYIHNYASREETLQAAAEFRKEKESEILARHLAGNKK